MPHNRNTSMPYVQVENGTTGKLLEDIEVEEENLGELVEGLYDRITEEYTIVIIPDESPRMTP